MCLYWPRIFDVAVRGLHFSDESREVNYCEEAISAMRDLHPLHADTDCMVPTMQLVGTTSNPTHFLLHHFKNSDSSVVVH